MADCEFLVRTRCKSAIVGQAVIVEDCALTMKPCYLVDPTVSPSQCTRRTWALDYVPKMQRAEIKPQGAETA
jgi:hypothetical protein